MKIYILMCLFLFSLGIEAQQDEPQHSENEEPPSEIHGFVYYEMNGEYTALPNIKVYWKEMPSMQTMTDSEGHFILNFHGGLFTLVAEKEGFTTSEVAYEGAEHTEFILHFEDEENVLTELEVQSRIASLSLDGDMATMTYQISDKELLKAACCNLSESFETNPSVDISYNDAVTGTKEILLLGLNQRYTSYSKDNINEIRGLAIYDGLEFFPGRWIQSLQLAKGTPSATTGYEGITGMINTNFYKYEDAPETKINMYFNQNARAEANVVSTQRLNDKWSNVTLLHGSSRFQKIDQNDDGFLDTPESSILNLSNVLRYNNLEGDGWSTFIGFQLLQVDKIGGQKDYHSLSDRLTTNAYGVENNTRRFTLWNKLGRFLPKGGNSMGFIQQFTYHNQEQTFGVLPYTGKEMSYEAKLLYDRFLGNSNHKLTAGPQFLYDSYEESYDGIDYERIERNVGLFAEYEYSHLEKLKVLLGARLDFHNLAGTQFSPKVHLKYSPFSKTSIRVSAGRSFRTANVWEENQKYQVSQRQFQIIPTEGGEIYGLAPEEAWNYGVSVNQEFRLFSRKSSITVDYFRTDFQNQVVADVDAHPQRVYLYNIENGSHYNSFQTLLTTSIVNGFDVRLAYKYYETKIDYSHATLTAPFVAKNRGFLNLGYETQVKEGRKWSFDTTLQWVGSMRLPDTSTNPEAFRRPKESENFFTLNGQIAREFSSHFRAYLGAENITSYTQDNPIIEVENPFGNYFDASMIYAPIMPINLYVGLDINF